MGDTVKGPGLFVAVTDVDGQGEGGLVVRYDLIDASHRPPDLGRVPGVVPGCCPASPIGETPGGGLGACPGDQSRGGSDGISGRDFSAVPTEVPSGGDPVGGRLASGAPTAGPAVCAVG